nr:hypothetical protein Itr_chr12CG24340 [Ipomoea trifida]
MLQFLAILLRQKKHSSRNSPSLTWLLPSGLPAGGTRAVGFAAGADCLRKLLGGGGGAAEGEEAVLLVEDSGTLKLSTRDRLNGILRWRRG